jgi:hypothetical protein
MDPMPPEALLAGYPEPMRQIAESLRAIVRRAVPEAAEAVRPGWRLIGYDVPAGRRRSAYFCWVAPERDHVHLGFEYGIFMADRDGVLQGKGITRKVRWVTLRESDPIPEEQLAALVREAARVALLPRAERLVAVLDREAGPEDGAAGPENGESASR